MNDWPTTRRFPRTMQQAFPHDREWAYPLEASRRITVRSIARHAFKVLAVLWFVVLFAHALVEWAAQ